MQALTTENLNIENFTFKLKNVDGKYQTKLVDKNTGYAPIIKTDFVIIPFIPSSYAKNKGATENLTDWTVTAKASCYQTLELNNIEYDYDKNKEGIRKLMKFFDDLYEKGIDFAHEHSLKFFKKELKREIIEQTDYVQKIIKKSTKKDNEGNFYPDTFSTKILKNMNNDSIPDLVIEDLEGNTIPIESWSDIENKLCLIVTPGTPARLIIQVRTYLVNAKFGFTIKLCAIQIDNKKKNNMSNVFSFKEPVPQKSLIKKEEVTKLKDNETHDSEENSDVEVDENY